MSGASLVRQGAWTREAAFGELRSALSGRPGEQSWRRIIELLEGWSEQEAVSFEQAALPYAMEHVKGWPDRERVLPQRWLERLLGPGPHPQWWSRLSRAVRLHDLPSRELVREVVRGVSGGAFMKGMTVLELSGGYMRNLAVWMLARSPHLTNLKELDLSYNGLSFWGVQALLRAPHIGALRRLMLSGNGLGVREVAALVSCSDWGELEEVGLAHNRLDEGALISLARGTVSTRLKVLHLERNVMRDEGAAALGRSPLLSQLEVLALGHNQIHHRGGRALSGLVERLRVLELTGNPLTDVGVTALFRRGEETRLEALSLGSVSMTGRAFQGLSPKALSRLRVLDVSGNILGYQGVSAMCALELGELEVVDLSGVQLDERAASVVASGLGGGKVRQLSLSFNPLGALGARLVLEGASAAHLKGVKLDHCEIDGTLDLREARLEKLETLSLRSNALGDEGIGRLVQCGWLRGVKRLDLRRCGIGDEGAAWLAGCEHLEELEALDLGENPIGRAGAEALMKGRLRRLQSLALDQCLVGDAAARALARGPLVSPLKRLDLSWARELSAHGIHALRSSGWLSACEIIARSSPRRSLEESW